MRRMITKNGVIDAVNEGIESGEIEVGGGLPEFDQYDVSKVLTVIPNPDVPNTAIASWEPGIPSYGEAQEGAVLGIEADPETGDLQPGWITPAAGGGHCYCIQYARYNFYILTIFYFTPNDITTTVADIKADITSRGFTGWGCPIVGSFDTYNDIGSSSTVPSSIMSFIPHHLHSSGYVYGSYDLWNFDTSNKTITGIQHKAAKGYTSVGDDEYTTVIKMF